MKVTTEACLLGAWVASIFADSKTEFTALDIGTGTGLLSLMLAQKTKALIDAVEIDAEASIQAKENVEESVFKKRIRIINADILLRDVGKYQLIISNPPFYSKSLSSPDKIINLARHDSGLTLDQFIQAVDGLLENDGIFSVLIPASRFSEMMLLASNHHFHLIRQASVRQTQQHKVFREMLVFSRRGNDQLEKELITIREDGKYSERFAELLKDYYL